ncbi:helix-turn-helix domain-containing protein [Paenibacillus terrigena]|uniref:helix-turn-helix domain-containing protein n=1 Tax=Paenibacillus terrigena TaxID=369333 RepID=UPI00036DC3A5|nr:helix-turn-helix domain-containing protein [Paenibacillus terrigena]
MMTVPESREHKKVYIRILMSFIGCVILTLLATSTILYMNFEDIALKQVYHANSNSLVQIKNEVSKMTETATSLSSQIYNDSAVSKLLYYENPNIYDAIFAQQQLDNYRASLPFIESIYVYNAKSKQFYISSHSMRNGIQPKAGLDDEGILNIFNNFKKYKPFQPIPRTYNIGSIEKTKVSSYTYLCYSVINDNDFLNTAVVVNIADSWLTQRVEPTDGNPAGEQTFIMNQDGILYSKNWIKPILTDLSDLSYIQKILTDTDSSSYFVDTVNGVRSLISYTSPDTLGWRYVRITPYGNITHDISKMRFRTLYIIGGILLLGLCVSYIYSHRVYLPFDKVLRKFKTLEAEKRDHQYILKQDFLRNTILGRETNLSGVIQEKLQYFESKLIVDHPSCLVLLKIDQYAYWLEHYHGDLKLMKYAIMNISAEIASSTFNVETIDMGENHILLILNIRDPLQEHNQEAMLDMMHEMQTSILNHIKLSVSFTASPMNESVEQWTGAYIQIMEASMHRLFKGHGSIIFSQDIMNLKSKEYVFPAHKEKQLSESIMKGSMDESQSIFCVIVSETEQYPFAVLQLVISHLTITINNILRSLQKNNAFIVTPDFDMSVSSLNQAETMEEIHLPFFKLFEDISRMLEEKRSTKHEDFVNKVHEIVAQHYSDPNLSLNFIADQLSISPIYLSRLYKQLTVNSLSDVIGEMRMNKAKELLRLSEYTVSEIAEKTGFTNSSYFYRIFKKNNGITPNDYRKNTQAAADH